MRWRGQNGTHGSSRTILPSVRSRWTSSAGVGIDNKWSPRKESNLRYILTGDGYCRYTTGAKSFTKVILKVVFLLLAWNDQNKRFKLFAAFHLDTMEVVKSGRSFLG